MKNLGTIRLIGDSPLMAELQQEIDRVARSDAKVLITGESGVGKELVAVAIHTRSTRASRAMVAVNCAGIGLDGLERRLAQSDYTLPMNLLVSARRPPDA